MNAPVQTEIGVLKPPKLVKLVNPWSRDGKRTFFDVYHVNGAKIGPERLKLTYFVEYMPRLVKHRVTRHAKRLDGWTNSAFIADCKLWNKHIDVPSMIEAVSALEDMITEEVAKWK